MLEEGVVWIAFWSFVFGFGIGLTSSAYAGHAPISSKDTIRGATYRLSMALPLELLNVRDILGRLPSEIFDHDQFEVL